MKTSFAIAFCLPLFLNFNYVGAASEEAPDRDVQHAQRGLVDRQSRDGWSQLHWIAYQGDQETVQLFLDSGIPINVRDSLGRTPLDIAIQEERVDMACVLMRNGATVGTVERDYHMLRSLDTNYSQAVQDSAESRVRQREGVSAQVITDVRRLNIGPNRAQRDRPEIVAEQQTEPSLSEDLKRIVHNELTDDQIIALIDEQEGVDIITLQRFDLTQLDQVVVLANGKRVVHLDTIRSMIASRGPLRDPYTREYLSSELLSYVRNYVSGQQNQPDQQNDVHNNARLRRESAIDMLQSNARGRREYMLSLLQDNADVEERSGLDALYNNLNHLRRSRDLENRLRNRARLNRELRRDLFAAVEHDDSVSIRQLLSRGADINARSLQGDTLLHYAVQLKNYGIVSSLIDKGVQLDVKDRHDQTALHRAVQGQDMRIVRILIEANARLDLQDDKKKTALHMAVERQNDEISKALVSRGARLNIQDDHGRTPLHVATQRRNIELALMLASAGPAEVATMRDCDGNCPCDLWPR